MKRHGNQLAAALRGLTTAQRAGVLDRFVGALDATTQTCAAMYAIRWIEKCAEAETRPRTPPAAGGQP